MSPSSEPVQKHFHMTYCFLIDETKTCNFFHIDIKARRLPEHTVLLGLERTDYCTCINPLTAGAAYIRFLHFFITMYHISFQTY